MSILSWLAVFVFFIIVGLINAWGNAAFHRSEQRLSDAEQKRWAEQRRKAAIREEERERYLAERKAEAEELRELLRDRRTKS